MKGTENNHVDAPKDGAQNDSLEELFRYATARKRPPDQDEQAIRAAVHVQWREMTGHRTRRRFMYALTAVASLVLAAFVGTIWLNNAGPVTQPAIQLASVEIVKGSVFIHPAGDAPAALAETDSVVRSGQQIVTGLESRLALRWRDGTSVRLDENSEIRLGSSGELRLVSGKVYVDSDATRDSASPLIILTPAGPVRHLGTQYLTRVDAGKTSLSVREGQVALEMSGVDFVVTPGERLIVDSTGDRTRQLIERYGAMWEWTQELAPAFVLDGRSLADFMDFVGRETGRAVHYSSPQAKQLAIETQLRGKVEIEPGRALDAILQTTDLVSETRDGTIRIALQK